MQSTITKKTCEISNKEFEIEEVEHVLRLIELLPAEPKIGFKPKNEDLAWALWGIGVLKPYKTNKRIFEPLDIKWKVGPNFYTFYDSFLKL